MLNLLTSEVCVLDQSLEVKGMHTRDICDHALP